METRKNRLYFTELNKRKMENLIEYETDTYTLSELRLSKGIKANLFEYAREAEKHLGKCQKITVCGKWPEPFPNLESKTHFTTWRIFLEFENGKQEVKINRRAIY